MKKLRIFTIAFALLAFVIAAPAQAALTDMSAAVYKWEGGMSADGKAQLTQITSGITFKVLAKGASTAETLYYPGKMTSLTNPVTTASFASTTICNKKVAFRVDPTDSSTDRYVDLIVVDTDGGYTAFIANFDQYTHTVVIDERPNVLHHGMIWFGDAATTGLVNTGIAFKLKTFITDVRPEVVTVESAISVDIGLGAAAATSQAQTAGFRSNVLVTTAGFPDDTAVITDGPSIDYYPATTYGTLLYTAITGAGTATSTNGGKTWLGYAYTSATTSPYLTYIVDGTTVRGYVHYWFTKMR